jgi:hypothetical protein
MARTFRRSPSRMGPVSTGETNPRRRWRIPLAFAVGFDALLFVVSRLILAVPTPPGPLL